MCHSEKETKYELRLLLRLFFRFLVPLIFLELEDDLAVDGIQPVGSQKEAKTSTGFLTVETTEESQDSLGRVYRKDLFAPVVSV